jgi:hypothetical protein
LSGDTLTALNAYTPLPQRGRKRPRTEPQAPTAQASLSDEGDVRVRYPIETKKPYLTCKTLHKKKLTLACTISRVENDLNSGRSPMEMRLQHRIPGRIAHHTGLKTQWDQVLDEGSKKLAHLFLDKLAEDYTQTKRRIEEKFGAMKDALEPSQFEEIKDSLTTKYKKQPQNHQGNIIEELGEHNLPSDPRSTAANNTGNQSDKGIKDQTGDYHHQEGKLLSEEVHQQTIPET